MSATDSLFSSFTGNEPNFDIETRLFRDGFTTVAGVDEAGRGPLAGPVVAAAVILDPERIPHGLNDSKKLTEKSRAILFDQILKTSHTSWASLPAPVIDRVNIREAALEAMTISVRNLPTEADAVLIDGRDVPSGLTNTGRAYVKGDARSLSIAAASIVAKVVRDRMMIEVDRIFPEYGFSGHKGYGSKAHRDAINNYGPCRIHRMSFSPMKDLKNKI
ncbi:MAG: ribonuclease HII [Rhizobiaceae bacterium]